MSIIEQIERRANRTFAEVAGRTLIEDLSPDEQKSAMEDGIEQKVRYVRTPAGVRRFKQPIGSIIVRDSIGSLDRIRIKDPVFKGFDLIEDRKGNLYDVGKDDSNGKYVALKHNTWDDQIEPADTLDDALKALNEKLGGGSSDKGTDEEKPAPKKKPVPKKEPSTEASEDEKPEVEAPSKDKTSKAEIVDGKFVITTPDGKTHTRTAAGKKAYTHALIRRNKGKDNYLVSFASDAAKANREAGVHAEDRDHIEVVELPSSGKGGGDKDQGESPAAAKAREDALGISNAVTATSGRIEGHEKAIGALLEEGTVTAQRKAVRRHAELITEIEDQTRAAKTLRRNKATPQDVKDSLDLIIESEKGRKDRAIAARDKAEKYAPAPPKADPEKRVNDFVQNLPHSDRLGYNALSDKGKAAYRDSLLTQAKKGTLESNSRYDALTVGENVSRDERAGKTFSGDDLKTYNRLSERERKDLFRDIDGRLMDPKDALRKQVTGKNPTGHLKASRERAKAVNELGNDERGKFDAARKGGATYAEAMEKATGKAPSAPKAEAPKPKTQDRTKAEAQDIARRLKGAQDALDKFEKIKNDPYAQSADYSSYSGGKTRFAIQGDFEQADMWLRNRDLLDKYTPEERAQAEKLREQMRAAAAEIVKDPSIMTASKSRAKERAEAMPTFTAEDVADARQKYRAVRSLSDAEMRNFLSLNEAGRKGYIEAFRQHRNPARAHLAGIHDQRKSRGQDPAKGGTIGGQGTPERDAFIEGHPKLKDVLNYDKPKLRDLSEKNFRAFVNAVDGGKSPTGIGAIMDRVAPGISWNPITKKWSGQEGGKRRPVPVGDTSASDTADAAVRDRVEKMRAQGRATGRKNPFTDSLSDTQKRQVNALTPGEYATYMNRRDAGLGHRGAMEAVKPKKATAPKKPTPDQEIDKELDRQAGSAYDFSERVIKDVAAHRPQGTPVENADKTRALLEHVEEALDRVRKANRSGIRSWRKEDLDRRAKRLEQYRSDLRVQAERHMKEHEQDQAIDRRTQENRRTREAAEQQSSKFGNTGTMITGNRNLLKEIVSLGRSGKNPAPLLPQLQERIAETEKRLAQDDMTLGGFHLGKGRVEAQRAADEYRAGLQDNLTRFRQAENLINAQASKAPAAKPSTGGTYNGIPDTNPELQAHARASTERKPFMRLQSTFTANAKRLREGSENERVRNNRLNALRDSIRDRESRLADPKFSGDLLERDVKRYRENIARDKKILSEIEGQASSDAPSSGAQNAPTTLAEARKQYDAAVSAQDLDRAIELSHEVQKFERPGLSTTAAKRANRAQWERRRADLEARKASGEQTATPGRDNERVQLTGRPAGQSAQGAERVQNKPQERSVSRPAGQSEQSTQRLSSADSTAVLARRSLAKLKRARKDSTKQDIQKTIRNEITYLQRELDRSGDRMPPEQRAEIQALVRELEAAIPYRNRQSVRPSDLPAVREEAARGASLTSRNPDVAIAEDVHQALPTKMSGGTYGDPVLDMDALDQAVTDGTAPSVPEMNRAIRALEAENRKPDGDDYDDQIADLKRARDHVKARLDRERAEFESANTPLFGDDLGIPERPAGQSEDNSSDRPVSIGRFGVTSESEARQMYSRTPTRTMEQIPKGGNGHIGNGIWIKRCPVCGKPFKSVGAPGYSSVYAKHEASHGGRVVGYNAPML